MSDSVETKAHNESEPQCQHFVVRKKRLCRMTVRPGKKYCGEHEPHPRDHGGQKDTRVPCPLDPKHTCYASKLQKHLLICNARPREQPPYIEHNINSPPDEEGCVRKPLSEYSKELVARVINKVNMIYDKYVKEEITTFPEHPIHRSVREQFEQPGRAESSRRHLRQTSALLHIAEAEGLVAPDTCYLELGAGKGQLSYHACVSWCGTDSRSAVVLVDRSALRHKRDNRAECDAALRLRTDLAHLRLALVPAVQERTQAVALAKHLCGVATDLALRCVTAADMRTRTSGAVLATCCHHRCTRAGFYANHVLHEMGITAEDFNIMLGIVSWATCGDGRSRDRRQHDTTHDTSDAASRKRRNSMRSDTNDTEEKDLEETNDIERNNAEIYDSRPIDNTELVKNDTSIEDCVNEFIYDKDSLESKEQPSKDQTKALITNISNNDITTKSISQENINIDSQTSTNNNTADPTSKESKPLVTHYIRIPPTYKEPLEDTSELTNHIDLQKSTTNNNTSNSPTSNESKPLDTNNTGSPPTYKEPLVVDPSELSRAARAAVGGHAKLVLDHARVRELRARGFDARLCRYVNASVCVENIAIVATRRLAHTVDVADTSL